MNKTTRLIIVMAVVAVATLAFVASQNRPAATFATSATASTQLDGNTPAPAKLPRLVDLGAGKCVPCKMMKPILEELRTNYASQFTTVFIDVWENPAIGDEYGIEVIPTQIFYDIAGRECFRHVGFYSKDDILAKWRELGVDVK